MSSEVNKKLQNLQSSSASMTSTAGWSVASRRLMAGMCRSIKGQYPEAIQEFQTARTMNPEATFPLAGLGISYAKSGNKAAATKVSQDMEKLAKVSYVSPIFIGLVYDALGSATRNLPATRKATTTAPSGYSG